MSKFVEGGANHCGCQERYTFGVRVKTDQTDNGGDSTDRSASLVLGCRWHCSALEAYGSLWRGARADGGYL